MLKNSTILNGNEIFKNSYFKKHEIELIDLVENGQHPKALFIGCADSRVVPNLITQTGPGELFVLRNVGNFVAPYKPDEDFHATASGIEYAVSVLNVKEIIICGHTQCGAIASLYSDLDDKLLKHTKKWLTLGEKAKSVSVMAANGSLEHEELLRLTERVSVVFQIENLLSYPAVKEKVDSGEIHIHGWMYDMSKGTIDCYNPDTNIFESLSSIKDNKDAS